MNWGDITFALAWPPVYTLGCAALARAFRGVTTWRAALRPWLGRWLAACGGVVLAGLAWYSPEAGIGVVLAAAGIAAWWWLRRRRDRAPRTFGAKGRALVAALVRKARESARPRPVLRPVPGGAR